MSWERKSETPGTPSVPTPSPSSSGGGPLPDSSDYAGFGHNWTPPATSVGNGSGGFATPSLSGRNDVPWVGGDSQSRK